MCACPPNTHCTGEGQAHSTRKGYAASVSGRAANGCAVCARPPDTHCTGEGQAHSTRKGYATSVSGRATNGCAVCAPTSCFHEPCPMPQPRRARRLGAPSPPRVPPYPFRRCSRWDSITMPKISRSLAASAAGSSIWALGRIQASFSVM